MLAVDGQTRDQRIGRNIATLRGEASQQSVADAMRQRGHKWSQATVWSVEKGERPLRLTEAQDLMLILGGHLWQLDKPTAAIRALDAAEKVSAAGAAVAKAVYELLAAKNRLDVELEDAVPIDDDFVSGLVSKAEDLQVDDAVEAGMAEWEHVSSGEEGERPKNHPALIMGWTSRSV